MSNISIIKNYLSNIEKGYKSGNYTEHSYRNELIELIKNLINDDDINITNEPKRQKCGAPDYIINKRDIIIGYIEVKDVGVDLKDIENTEQINKYRKSLDNLILSNYFDFIFYRNGEKIEEISLAKIEKNKIKENLNNFQIFEKYIIDFCNYRGITIKSTEDLAKIMARKTSIMKDIIFNALKDEEDNSLKDQFKVFKEILIHDLSEESFADTYAQTIAYGLFAARLHDSTKDSFSRGEALFLIPKSNPFLRQLFSYVAGPELDERVVWIVNDLCEIFKSADLSELLSNFGNSTGQNDPFLHFYETFLAEYNPELRKSRGVYYTPQPIVNFIVRAVNDILKKEFNIQKGLADSSKIKLKIDKENKEFHKVQILDPAAGTGTFLDEIVKEIYKEFYGQEGIWSDYVENHLIPRLNGFEILMASYTVCHIKLEMLLKEYGYKPKDENRSPRLKIFLTNSLDEAHEYSGTLLASWLAKETTEANKIKQETPVMVVIGNPPYSGISSNMGEWICNLIEEYKYVNGKYFNERKHWLHDDYVKFIRVGEYFINKNNEGILAYINNHSFLDNPTFRGMRWHLLKTFDKIYIIDLHGNAKKKEKAPDGTIDENVFNIQQGVSINIFIKTGKKKENELAKVYHYDLYGSSENKYSFLLKNSLESIEFKEVKYSEPYYFFVPKDFKEENEYEKGFKLQEIFQVNVTGIVTMGDNFIISENLNELKNRLNYFKNNEISIEWLNKEFRLGKNYAEWILKNKNDIIIDESKFIEVSYRPFDKRWTYFDNKLIWRWRIEVMQHFIKGENLGITLCRQFKTSQDYFHIFISNKIIESSFVSNKTSEITYIFPLYLYPENDEIIKNNRKPNLNQEIINKITDNLNLKFSPEKIDEPETISPIDIFDYIYAILYSPSYRRKYKEFLKVDFPRIPYPNDKEIFYKLVKLGSKLRTIHLFEDPILENLITTFPVSGTNKVEKVDYENGKVWINKTQYFDKVPEIIWTFYIGGYQPAQKWLKDRIDKILNYDDIIHYQKIIVALNETINIMNEIDKIIIF